ncbi:hypothetical protein CEXT_313161 [Caerostris extrusa]|uniref:Ycf15 n=1 Tax=Caerostris extrusa TaxID=172846 RepID=A0AAV4MAN4_CAEEX|nr:hypothetical protein CEXT_313161 [Caerostris extrusa]
MDPSCGNGGRIMGAPHCSEGENALERREPLQMWLGSIYGTPRSLLFSSSLVEKRADRTSPLLSFYAPCQRRMCFVTNPFASR